MTKIVYLTIFGLALLVGCRQPSPTEQSPTVTVESWNDALHDGDVELAARLTSVTSNDYVSQAFGSIADLSQKYQNMEGERPRTIFESEKIDGDIARVIYSVYYPDGSIKVWEDTLFREDGRWRVAPQFVRAIAR